jgi:signal transduction histidine kinase
MLDTHAFVVARRDEPPGTVPVAWDHARGPLDASTVLVFYGAYLCPRSRRLWSVVREVAERSSLPLRLVCRQLPGRSTRSLAEALLSERAAEAGHFWEVHERMISSTDGDGRSEASSVDGWHHPSSAASGVGALAPWDRIGEHARMARVLGVGEGPAIFVNGRRYKGVAECGALLAAIASLAEERVRRGPGRGELDDAGRVLSVVSHELRGALSPLLLALYPGARDASEASLPEDVLNRLNIARRQARVLARHLEHLAEAYAGRASLFQPRPVSGDLVQIVRSVLASAALVAGRKTLTLTLDADDEITGYWDALRIEQIVANLVSNAVKYGGAKPITVVAKKVGPYVRLAVRDQGEGMSREELVRLFRPHARLERHRRSPGIGLGLFIVRSLAEAHRGRVFVASDPGLGSSIGVDLPLALPDATPWLEAGSGRRALAFAEDGSRAEHIADGMRPAGCSTPRSPFTTNGKA